MCEPATIAMLALTVASTTATYVGQERQARSQTRYYKQAAEEGQKLALESLAVESSQLALRSKQEAEAKSQAVQKTQTDYLRAKSTAKVASGESGVSGTSIDQLLADFDFQEDLEVSAIKTNASYAEQQLSMEKLGLRGQARLPSFSHCCWPPDRWCRCRGLRPLQATGLKVPLYGQTTCPGQRAYGRYRPVA